MVRLTTIHMRQERSGVVVKYRTRADCEALTQKLGTIEYGSEDLISRACDHSCRIRGEADPDELPGICEECPVNKLAELIGV